MYGEFCIVLDKKNCGFPNIKNVSQGSLLHADTNVLNIDNITFLFRSYGLDFNFCGSIGRVLLGEAIYKGSLMQNASQCDWDDVDDFKRNARGNWALIEVDLCSQSIEVFNDSLGLYPVYFFENDDVSVVSNLPLWMEGVLKDIGVFVKRDGLLAAYELAMGTGAFGVTAWSEISLLKQGASAYVNKSNLNIVENLSEKRFFNCSLTFDELIDEGEKDLRENVRAISNSNYKLKICDVTGGKDSRLVLSAILGEELKDGFVFNTQGSHPKPDANSALNIMDKLSLTRVRWRRDYKPLVGEAPIAAFKSFLYQSQGMRLLYDRPFETNIVQPGILMVGGGLAGGFKSAFSLRVSKEKGQELLLEEAVDSMFLPSAKHVADNVIQDLRGKLLELFSDLKSESNVSYRTIMDFFYVLSRNRYFIGIGEFPNSLIRPKIHALYSEALISASIKLKDEERLSSFVHFKLIGKMFPRLLSMPFADKGWGKYIEKMYEGTGFVNNVINYKSPRLYNDVSTTVVHVSALPQNIVRDSDEVLNVDPEWRQRQKELGRNWLWLYFDNIHSVARRFFNNGCFLESGIKETVIEDVINKDYGEFKKSGELRVTVELLMHKIFQEGGEVPTSVKRSEDFSDHIRGSA